MFSPRLTQIVSPDLSTKLKALTSASESRTGKKHLGNHNLHTSIQQPRHHCSHPYCLCTSGLQEQRTTRG